MKSIHKSDNNNKAFIKGMFISINEDKNDWCIDSNAKEECLKDPQTFLCKKCKQKFDTKIILKKHMNVISK